MGLLQDYARGDLSEADYLQQFSAFDGEAAAATAVLQQMPNLEAWAERLAPGDIAMSFRPQVLKKIATLEGLAVELRKRSTSGPHLENFRQLAADIGLNADEILRVLEVDLPVN